MSESVKVAMIASATIIVSVGLWLFYSPYQTCVRRGLEGSSQGATEVHDAVYTCAKYFGGRD